ncbi:hypothetical protein MHH49_17730 [Paenibacillus sp. FSL F4-0122]|uniref:hypothetical protein n=1 Tax=Paenibacillus sp. FSL F4-0122 TaxID=2921371 RepID=UPI0030F92B37
MHNIQVGSLVLNGQLIFYFWFGTAGWLMLHYRNRNQRVQEEVLPLLTNAFWLWMVIWKASYLLFYPVEVIRRPISLLYYDGGERGAWLAALAAVVYIWRAASKRNIIFMALVDGLIIYMLAGYLASRILLLLTGVEHIWFHLTSLVLALVLLILLQTTRAANLPAARRFVYVVWFCIGHIVLWFFISERQTWFLSFNKQQVFFLITAAGLAGMGGLTDNKQKRGLDE